MPALHLFAFSDPLASKITLAVVLVYLALDTFLVRRRRRGLSARGSDPQQIGALLRGWAILALRRYFSRTVAETEGQQVVTSGPYALVRHPSYTGALVAFAAFGLILANWLSLGVLIVLPVAVYVRRIQVEERVLLQVLGVVYSTYAGGKARLWPGVW